MTRSVFFSFHYQRDILRVQQVKQHYITKRNYTEAGFFDGSLEEKSKREGDQAVISLIDKGLPGSSVLCVLIGNETYTRRWVDYEIFRAISLGMGIFGIRIHQLKDPNRGADLAGENPFYYLGYALNNATGKLQPMIRYNDGWKNAPYQSLILSSSARYLPAQGIVLKDCFSVYDWVDGNGYQNFGTWVEAAALQAGR